MEEVMNGILIREVETKNIMTKSSLPVGGYSVNPYVGCTWAAASALRRPRLGQSLCGLYTCLQVLLCFFYEALYRAQGGMGHFP